MRPHYWYNKVLGYLENAFRKQQEGHYYEQYFFEYDKSINTAPTTGIVLHETIKNHASTILFAAWRIKGCIQDSG